MFWFKKKKIVLDCFTADPFAFQYTPISSATNYFPEWWKSMDSYFNTKNNENKDITMGSMKHCRGFIDLYKNSFMIPYWGNLGIEVSDIIQKQYSWNTNFGSEYVKLNSKNNLEEHSPQFFKGFVDSNFQHVKLVSPWSLKTNRYVKFFMSDSLWNRNNLTNYSVLPGVIDFKYQLASHVNLMFEYKNTSRIIKLKPNDPLVMLTPLTEEHIELKHHLVSIEELSKMFSFNRAYSNKYDFNSKKYHIIKKFIDEHDKRNKPKCPFGFGK